MERARRRSIAKSAKATMLSSLKTTLMMKMKRHCRSDSSFG
jgi:hypothetical protein